MRGAESKQEGRLTVIVRGISDLLAVWSREEQLELALEVREAVGAHRLARRMLFDGGMCITRRPKPGWANTLPMAGHPVSLPQNGCLRILTADRYPRPQPLGAVAARLAEAVPTPHHAFWMDAIPC